MWVLFIDARKNQTKQKNLHQIETTSAVLNQIQSCVFALVNLCTVFCLKHLKKPSTSRKQTNLNKTTMTHIIIHSR